MSSNTNEELIELLPADALHGKSLGISVSQSPDLDRLGLTEDHFRMTLGELGRSVLIAGGNLYYGGHLDPDGYTAFLMQELQKYGHKRKPLKVCLAWSEHQRISDETIKEQRLSLGMFGEIILLDIEGSPLPDDYSKEVIDTNLEKHLVVQSLTSLRVFLAEQTDARIMIGGKRNNFQGQFPGLVEEAIISLEKKQPLFLAGGLGGVTLNIIDKIAPELTKWFPLALACEGADERLEVGLSQLLEIQKQSGWVMSSNGLTIEENTKLCATYRPSEIAAFVSLGLGRLTDHID